MDNQNFFRITVKGGLLFLIPVGFVLLALGKAFQLVLEVARPIGELLQIEGLIGYVIINVIAILILVLICFVAGMLATRPWFRAKVSRLENILLSNVPLYSFIDGMMRSVAAAEDQASNLTPVIAHFDDNSQLGFEIERTEPGAVVIYLPGSPNPWSGTTVYMPEERVEPLDIKTHEAIKLIRVLGRGSGHLTHRRGWKTRPAIPTQ